MEILIFFIFIWLILGAIGYKMAENRGRSTTLGFFAGALFGLFAYIVYWMIGKTDAKKRQNIRDEEEVRQFIRNNS